MIYRVLVAIVVFKLLATFEEHRPFEFKCFLNIVVGLCSVLHQQIFVNLHFLILFLHRVTETDSRRLLGLLKLEIKSNEFPVEQLIQQMTHALSVTLPIINGSVT
jgi:hypothetical protein